jgi:hypothetical protein
MFAGSFTEAQRAYRAENAQEHSPPHQGTRERSAIEFAAIADAVQPRPAKESDKNPQEQEHWWDKAWRHWGRRFFTDLKVTDVLIAISSVFLALFTARLWISTAGLWETALRQSRHLENTAERQLRAYVNIWDAEIIFTSVADVSPNVQIKFRNTGQTPAYRVMNRCNYFFSLIGTPNSFMLPSDGARYADLGPGQHSTATIIVPLAQWERNRPHILAKRIILYAFGEISYFDTFEKRQFTKYRLQIPVDDEGITDGRLLFSEGGNESS